MSARFPNEAYEPRDRGADRARALTWAGVFLALAGSVHLVQGILALVNGEYFTKRTEYLFKLDMTTWGWVHLVGGTAMVLTAVAVFSRMSWGKPAAITLAAVSILVSFAWLPFHILGSMTAIAIDCFVIGAVVAPGVFERDD